MRDPKGLELFRELLNKTEAGKVPWKPTAEEDSYIATELGKLTIKIIPYRSKDGWNNPVGPPTVVITDSKQNVIVEITDAIDGVREEDLQALLVFARRTALNADAQIDELLAELKKADDDLPF
ncbi:MAG: hypothetical protein WB555_00885 [Candidatus Korobacteraceae bacterium]